jgi:periplasmic mercuric ion binding protein
MNQVKRRMAIAALTGVLVTAIALCVSPAEPVLAATKTVTLDVPGMTCAACPITVKTALTKLKGVEKAEVSFPKKEAVVTFDDSKTKIEELTEATKKAGYPSTVKK